MGLLLPPSVAAERNQQETALALDKVGAGYVVIGVADGKPIVQCMGGISKRLLVASLLAGPIIVDAMTDKFDEVWKRCLQIADVGIAMAEGGPPTPPATASAAVPAPAAETPSAVRAAA